MMIKSKFAEDDERITTDMETRRFLRQKQQEDIEQVSLTWYDKNVPIVIMIRVQFIFVQLLVKLLLNG